MIKHVVMWKVAGRDKEEKKGNIKEILDLLNSLPASVPHLLNLEAGQDFNGSSFACDIALITTHQNREELENYRVHQEHQQVARRIGELTTDRTVVDFENK